MWNMKSSEKKSTKKTVYTSPIMRSQASWINNGANVLYKFLHQCPPSFGVQTANSRLICRFDMD